MHLKRHTLFSMINDYYKNSTTLQNTRYKFTGESKRHEIREPKLKLFTQKKCYLGNT